MSSICPAKARDWSVDEPDRAEARLVEQRPRSRPSRAGTGALRASGVTSRGAKPVPPVADDHVDVRSSATQAVTWFRIASTSSERSPRPPSSCPASISRSASRLPDLSRLLGRACRRRSAPRSAADGKSGSRLFPASSQLQRARSGGHRLRSARSSCEPSTAFLALPEDGFGLQPVHQIVGRLERGAAMRARPRAAKTIGSPGGTSPQRWTTRTPIDFEPLEPRRRRCPRAIAW